MAKKRKPKEKTLRQQISELRKQVRTLKEESASWQRRFNDRDADAIKYRTRSTKAEQRVAALRLDIEKALNADEPRYASFTTSSSFV